MYKKIFYGICSFVLMGMLSACSYNFTSNVGNRLDPQDLNDAYGTKPIDLSAEGKCPGTLPLKVINKEDRTEEYIIYDSMGRTFYIIPNQFADYVVRYMELKLQESKVTVDDTKGKEIYVSIEEIKEENAAGGFSLWAWVKLKIAIPEINYSRVYSGEGGSAIGYNSVAYGVHHAVQEFLEDKVVQEYIQCR